VILIIVLQTGCVGLGFEVTVILQRIRVPEKLEGRKMDGRDIKSGTRHGDLKTILTILIPKQEDFANNCNLQF
jgi:hypothetical protein